jgi:outer membrane protein OmpA-like peptidoglycan-associated protein
MKKRILIFNYVSISKNQGTTMINIIKSVVLSAILLFLTTGCTGEPDYKEEPQIQRMYTSDKNVLMFVLDASQKMKERDSSGKVKMDVVKNIIHDTSSQINKNRTNVGLISFNNGCESTKLLIEPSNNDLNLLTDTVNAIIPEGKAPLAASMRKAGEVLKHIGKRTRVILISSGTDSCDGNSIEEAEKLKALYGIETRLYIIGYSVNAEERAELENIAKAGSGSYYNANDSAELDRVVTSITDGLGIKSDNWSGNIFKLKIYFNSSSYQLSEKYNPQIQELARYLKETNYSAEIQGHSDSWGSSGKNKTLSKKRAQSVVNRLVEFGVDRSNVYSVGYGEAMPIAKNTTRKGRDENRRVEAHIRKSSR